jgi:hypothetical protein
MGPTMTGPVAGARAAPGFPEALALRREIMDRASEAELQGIAADLHRKSVALRDLLSNEASLLDRARLGQVLRWVFATRRHADLVLSSIGPRLLAAAIAELLAPGGPVADRVDRFDAALAERAGVAALAWARADLPGELLHFNSPDQYWLWTRWMWDPAARTGALALVTTGDLTPSAGAARGAVYMTVGQATAFAAETSTAAGFSVPSHGPFGVDVFLASVYALHMYTVLQVRMSREFASIVPPLPHIVRRLLGVYHLEG